MGAGHARVLDRAHDRLLPLEWQGRPGGAPVASGVAGGRLTHAAWGIVLLVAALIAIGLQVRRWRARRITTLQFAAGLIARGGFLVLGILYAFRLVYRWPRAPLVGLAIVGAGIVLNLAAGIIDNIRRARAPFGDSDHTDD
ncbi:MAG TPA: hypothetical protein VK933_00500 [Longimicrobiales bacterium]|nr:hypothetical protein [Longimicrobiales bacterium]